MLIIDFLIIHDQICFRTDNQSGHFTCFCCGATDQLPERHQHPLTRVSPPAPSGSAPWRSPRFSSLSSQRLACDKMHDGSLPSRPSSAGGDALKQKRSVMYASGLPHTHKHTQSFSEACGQRLHEYIHVNSQW